MPPFMELFGAEPSAVVVPGSLAELEDAVRNAVAAGRAVVPHGAGTGQDYGYPVRAEPFVLMDTSGLNRVVAVEPGDLTITVEAGVTLAAVQAALRPHGLFLPLDPPHADRATVGGVLATNAFGASRLGYGTARDWLIGLSVVNAEGRLVKGGGKVVKNVTGYDIPKLHVGALGTLGVLAEATFKVAPLPEETRTVVVPLPEGGGTAGAMAVTRILSETSPTQLYRRTDAHGDFFVCVYEGFVEVVTQQAGLARDAFQGAAEIYSEPLEMAENVPVLSLRLHGPLAKDSERHESVLPNAVLDEELGTVVKTFYGTGMTEIQWQRPATVPADRCTTFTTGLTGHVYTHAPLVLRQHNIIRVWSPEPASLPLMRRVKDALDPGNVFNPGRFVVR